MEPMDQTKLQQILAAIITLWGG